MSYDTAVPCDGTPLSREKAELRHEEETLMTLLDVKAINEYQQIAVTTAVYPEKGTGSVMALAYVGLGLGEAGEVQGKIKKILRDDSGVVSDEKREAVAAEAGDILWYIANLAEELGTTIGELMEQNLHKLLDRKQRGVIGGSGDNR